MERDGIETTQYPAWCKTDVLTNIESLRTLCCGNCDTGSWLFRKGKADAIWNTASAPGAGRKPLALVFSGSAPILTESMDHSNGI